MDSIGKTRRIEAEKKRSRRRRKVVEEINSILFDYMNEYTLIINIHLFLDVNYYSLHVICQSKSF